MRALVFGSLSTMTTVRLHPRLPVLQLAAVRFPTWTWAVRSHRESRGGSIGLSLGPLFVFARLAW